MSRSLKRFTVRGVMALLFVLAVLLHVGRTAYRAASIRDKHFHTYVLSREHEFPASGVAAAGSPFWPRFWRGLLGMPCAGPGFCRVNRFPPGWAYLLETCELEHPEIAWRPNPYTVGWSHTQAQKELEERLKEIYAARERVQVLFDGF